MKRITPMGLRGREARAVRIHVAVFAAAAVPVLAADALFDAGRLEWWSFWLLGLWAVVVVAHLLGVIGRIEVGEAHPRRNRDARSDPPVRPSG